MRFVVSVSPRSVTHELIESSGEFGLSFCSEEQARVSHVWGSYSLRVVNKWELADFETYRANAIEPPMIAHSVLNVECRVTETHRLGDHTVFIGESVWVRYDPDLKPLIYHDGKYFRLGSQIPKE